jgi:hypothetical protein
MSYRQHLAMAPSKAKADGKSAGGGGAHAGKPKSSGEQKGKAKAKADVKPAKADGAVGGGIGATGGEEAESVVGEKWYEEAEAAALEVPRGKQRKQLPAGAATQCWDRAQALLVGMSEQNAKATRKNADKRWLGTATPL